MTKIPYCDETLPVVRGCSKVSPGCAHCYAERNSLRFKQTTKPWTPANAAENVTLHPELLTKPLHWQRPRTIFVCPTGDLFHEQVPDEFISWVFAVAAMSPQHRFLLLTKRAERMHQYLTLMESNPDAYVWAWAHEASNVFLGGAPAPSPLEKWPLPNVWLGVTAENQRWADERIPRLLKTPAARRWASVEPCLGPVDLGRWLPLHPEADLHCGKNWPHKDHTWPWPEAAPWAEWKNCPGSPFDPAKRIDWVVVGGESGPGHRRMELEWAADILHQCREAGVPAYFKQRSASRPGQPSGLAALDSAKELPWTR